MTSQHGHIQTQKLAICVYLPREKGSSFSSKEAMEEVRSTLEARLLISNAGFTTKNASQRTYHISSAGGSRLCIKMSWQLDLLNLFHIKFLRGHNGPKPLWLPGLGVEALMTCGIETFAVSYYP